MARLCPEVAFVFCGNSTGRADLLARCTGLPNVRFLDLQPAEQLPDLLATADIHLLPQKAEAADLVVLSMLTGMLASARTVVAIAHAGTGTGLRGASLRAGGTCRRRRGLCPGKRKALKQAGEMGELLDKAEKFKAGIRAKVEHPFRVIKRQFGYMKTLYRGLKKNTAQIATLFALSNLWMARHESMGAQA